MSLFPPAPLLAALGLLFAGLTVLPAAQAAPKADGPLQFTVQNIDGKTVKLDKYHGQVVLIVNTASLCGNTPQYASLEKLYETYHAKGLRILAFPANNFGQQEPGANGEIKEFCTGKYKTTFDLFSKVSVKGPDQAPLYKYLTDKTTNPQFGGDIEWNFAKFLVSRDGKVVARFPAGHDPLSPDVVAAVEQQIKAPRRRNKPNLVLKKGSRSDHAPAPFLLGRPAAHRVRRKAARSAFSWGRRPSRKRVS